MRRLRGRGDPTPALHHPGDAGRPAVHPGVHLQKTLLSRGKSKILFSTVLVCLVIASSLVILVIDLVINIKYLRTYLRVGIIKLCNEASLWITIRNKTQNFHVVLNKYLHR